MFYRVYTQNNNTTEPKKNVPELSCFLLFYRLVISCVIVPYLWIASRWNAERSYTCGTLWDVTF